MCHHTWGSLPLMLAVLTGSCDEAEVMLKHRADPEATNYRGASARSLAHELGSDEISRLFSLRKSVHHTPHGSGVPS
eukprot:CAMPEP_0176328268 /NCGR_PEP_ID=MMETSP0121_2-20121125/74877_1 /TAXON_ID=160619 /ORGANISM="Kryptoperidinium foliaceum, Strain CCMP 1326" /LENGTH=76 /DNA_ID=CAMNT_0017670937 /DNA_START=81 /DNA_END=311 /DNA_ORIENTATION=+